MLALCNSNKTAENSVLSFLPALPYHVAGNSDTNSLDTQFFANILTSAKDKASLQRLATLCANAFIEDSIINTLYIAIAVLRL